MKRIVIFLILARIFPLNICCQNASIIQDQYGPIYTSWNDSVLTYHTKEGKKLEIAANRVVFKHGEDALKKYLRNKYYQLYHPDDCDDNFRVFFFLLFDSNLKIKEVRGVVLPYSQFSESRKKRVKSYMKWLKHTKKQWIRETNQKWYVYCFDIVSD